MAEAYGIWMSAGKSGWWPAPVSSNPAQDDFRMLFYTPFKGVAEAQCHRLNELIPAGLARWQVRLIGSRGQPRLASTERTEKITPRKDERGTEYDHG